MGSPKGHLPLDYVIFSNICDRNLSIMKFLIIGGRDYGLPFNSFGDLTYDERDIFIVDAVVFTGGADVTPALYGEEKGDLTNNHEARDIEDVGLFGIAKRRKLPMFGICRGAQFLTVMNGGILRQHVENHALPGVHEITTSTGERLSVTSTHHQMMDLSSLFAGRDYELLSWADNLAGFLAEPETVLFQKTKGLLVQWHPEYMAEYTRGWKYYQELVHNHLALYSLVYAEEFSNGRD